MKLSNEQLTEAAARLVRDVSILRSTRVSVTFFGFDKKGLSDDIELLVKHCAEREDFILCSRCGEVMACKEESEGCKDFNCPIQDN